MAEHYFKLKELTGPSSNKSIREIIEHAETFLAITQHNSWVSFTYVCKPFKVLITKSNKSVAVPPTIAREIPIGIFINRALARHVLQMIAAKLDQEQYLSNYVASDMVGIYREYLNECLKDKVDLDLVDFVKIEKELTDKLVKMLGRLYVPYEVTHPKPVKTSSNWFRKLKWW